MSWRHLAACNHPHVDPDWFNSSLDVVPTRAMRICQSCPVRLNCLDEALARSSQEDDGVWGGTTLAARKHVRARRMTPGRAMGLGDRIASMQLAHERETA